MNRIVVFFKKVFDSSSWPPRWHGGNARNIAEQIKSEERLKQFEHFFNNSNDFTAIANSSGFFEIINPSFTKILGYSQNELTSNPFLDFVHPDDIAVTLDAYNQLKAGATLIHFINRYRKKNGDYIWLDWNATPNTATGKLYTIARDITDRKKAEDALGKLNEELEQKVADRTETIKKSEEQYRHLFENNPMPMWVIDLSNFNFLDVNHMATVQYGYSREEFLSMTALDIRPKEDVEAFVKSDHTFKSADGKPNKGIWNHVKKDGSIIQVEIIAHEIMFEGIKARLVLANNITENKKVEDKLAASEIRFRSLIENSAEAISLTDEFSNIIYKSPASQKITGKISQTNTLSRVHPEDEEIIKNKFKEALTKPAVPVTFQGRFKHALGHYYWVEGTINNLLNIKGVNAIVANYRDITQRKELEVLLHKANVLARMGGWEVSLTQGTVFWSEITREIHETADDYIPDLANGINFYKEGEGRDLIIKKVKEAIDLGQSWDVELQIITAKNNERWIRTIGEAEFVDGKCIRIYGSFQDIDHRKKAEERIAQTLKEKNVILESIGDAFFAVDKNWTVTYWNKIAEMALGVDKHTVIGNNLWEIFSNSIDSLSYKKYHNALESNQVVHFEDYHATSNKWYEISAYPSEDGLSVYFKDVTERKKNQEEIKELNTRLEEKVIKRTEELQAVIKELEAFSYTVSHDLRAPLRAIIGFTSILEEDYSSKLDDEAKRITSIIKNNTAKMGNLIDDLLSFSRLGRQPITKIKVNTNAVINEIIAESGFKNNSELTGWIIPGLPFVQADPNTIKQVWMNLIANAVKYSKKQSHPVIEIGTLKEKTETIFFVKDNGVGFDEKYKDKLFKVFQRLHSSAEFEGIGVGLAIVEKIISKHGGRVWATAAIDKGACFYFSLPDE